MNLEERLAHLKSLGRPGLASIDASPVHFKLPEGSVVTPKPTADDLEEYGYDAEFDLVEELDEAIEAFRDRGHLAEWQDGFSQQIYHVWPVCLFELTHEDVAETLAGLNIAVSIAEVPEESEELFGNYNALIVMTGGNMDLSPDIAQGYLACHQVPPTDLLVGLSSSNMDRIDGDDMKYLLGEAMKRAVAYHRDRALQVQERFDRMFTEDAAPRM